jgi:hypothetical protein
VSGWTQISGTVWALPAHRGAEEGCYLWIEGGERREALTAELYLPHVSPDELNGALGVATGAVRTAAGERSGDVRIEFGRVTGERGVLSVAGAGVDTDLRFELRRHPREGAFCSQCGSKLDVAPVDVITPPDGGVMGVPESRCGSCG